ncbi:MAG: GGDEF domain-containing protein [Pseudomonadales bacterium]|uniref:diguanylate cyclase n=1 Tax=Oleiphilus messinensis TaxID=141451 RepID=A0A1Y0I1V4_9GAMM|nr:GGDEF domain-containing protein [Oleiphilus messinensis]ARU54447.1 signal transduction diguanylate cyclase [Oleiphilus messinensis]MCG8613887.1 GGDEF domain-containing protein [Pseudomonadales bacterium]
MDYKPTSATTASMLTMAQMVAITECETLTDLGDLMADIFCTVFDAERVRFVIGNWNQNASAYSKTRHQPCFVLHLHKKLEILGSVIIENPHLVPGSEEIDPLLILFSNQIKHLNSRSIDLLTGLMNRQALETQIELYSRDENFLNQHKTPDLCVLALLEIDHFPRVNEAYGWVYGDEILIKFARLCSQIFREQDQLFRFGANQFAVLLRCQNKSEAALMLEQAQKQFRAHDFAKAKPLSVSIGYAVLGVSSQKHASTEIGVPLPWSVLIDRVNRALSWVKQQQPGSSMAYEAMLERGLVREPHYEVQADLF